jgi:hypothetical protein
LSPFAALQPMNKPTHDIAANTDRLHVPLIMCSPASKGFSVLGKGMRASGERSLHRSGCRTPHMRHD